MELRADDLYGNCYEYLHPGYCGPIYVNQIWTEDESAGAYVDKYWETGCLVFAPKRMVKAEIECENLEMLNYVLGQISNIAVRPFDDTFTTVTTNAQESITATINNEIINTLLKESIDELTEEIRLEAERCKRYKLKHKILYRC